MSRKKTTAEFAYELREVNPHLNLLSEYKSANDKVLVADKCGVYNIKPSDLIRGIYPTINVAVNKDICFINKAKEVHGDLYEYSKVNYINAHGKIIITCKEHGDFSQKANSHLNGIGCSECGRLRTTNYSRNNPTGWSYSDWETAGIKSSHFDSFKVYILRCFNESEEFYKIGRTFRVVGHRFKCKSDLPYEYEVVKTVNGSARFICELESELHNKHREFEYKPKIAFKGMCECFSKIMI